MKARHLIPILTLGLGLMPVSAYAVEYPGKNPGKAKLKQAGAGYTLNNNLIKTGFAQKGKQIVFTGFHTADGNTIAAADDTLFTVTLQNGKTLTSADFSCNELCVKKGKKKKSSGATVSATFTAPDESFQIEWQAILKNGAHYLLQEYTIKANKDVAFDSIVPLRYAIQHGGTPEVSGNTTHGNLVVNDAIFTGLETPMSIMTVGGQSEVATKTPTAWSKDHFEGVFGLEGSMASTYGSQYTEKDGPVLKGIVLCENNIGFKKGGSCTFKFSPSSGTISLLGVQLLNEAGKVISEELHTDASKSYKLHVPKAGRYTVRYWASSVSSSGTVDISLPLAESGTASTTANLVEGTWKRRTTLRRGTEWQVSSVIGLFAPEQKRRSFLAYHERERVQPYRTFIHYNDWYEIGIVVHDHKDPAKRTNDTMWENILNVWKTNLMDKHEVGIDCFVVDDGWDDFNSLWDFHVGFPKGFANINRQAKELNAGIGTWLGPVGGYGASKNMRIAYWNKTHPNNRIGSFELSNPEYFKAFTDRCKAMVKAYDMRYFKFDGISTKFHAKGPAGLEDAEGIISVIHELRKARPDLFINTTVGTWASPFWFHVADSIWRQENDFGQLGSMGDARDKWITYRDNLVYEVFVTGAPFCPINSLMTHGTIITKNGPPKVMSREPANCIKEMRAAFGCGSGLQELYVDSDLMMAEDGRLWKEMADCIRWIRKHEDVMADIHWVGGKPWNGSDGSIYGWAAWNKDKCTLTLRNSSASEKTMTTTLRQLLDVPPDYTGTVTLRSAFEDQRNLSIIGEPINVDKEIEITMQPMEVIVMDGKNNLKSSLKKEKKSKKNQKSKKTKKNKK